MIWGLFEVSMAVGLRLQQVPGYDVLKVARGQGRLRAGTERDKQPCLCYIA